MQDLGYVEGVGTCLEVLTEDQHKIGCPWHFANYLRSTSSTNVWLCTSCKREYHTEIGSER